MMLSTVAIGNAYALTQIGDSATIKTQNGKAQCIQDAISCGEGKLRAKLSLITTNTEDGISTGNAQGVIQGSGWGWLVSEKGDTKNIELQNNGPLSFVYDSLNRELKMSGTFVDTDNNVYQYDALGVIADTEKNHTSINLTINLISPDGKTIQIPVKGGVVLIPITTG